MISLEKQPNLWQYLFGGICLVLSLVETDDNYTKLYVLTATLIASAIAAAVSTGVAIKNSIAAKKAKRNADRTIGGMKADNAQNYYQDYYRSALNNDSTRAYLKKLDKAIEKQNKTLDNTVVSTGATHENMLAAKGAKNETMSNAMAQAVQAEDYRKQGIKNNYLNRGQQLSQQQLVADQNYSAQKQANLATAAQGISQAASAAAGAFSGGGGLGSASSGTLSNADLSSMTQRIAKAKNDFENFQYSPYLKY